MVKKLLIAIMALTAGGVALAQAQGGPGPRGGPGARMFDPATVVTVSGEVAAVRTVEGRRGAGIHFDLKTGEGVLDVHVGPAAFLAAKGLTLQQGDAVEVKGSKVQIAGKPALVAQTVKKGDTTVALRDASGIPAWSKRGTR